MGVTIICLTMHTVGTSASAVTEIVNGRASACCSSPSAA